MGGKRVKDEEKTKKQKEREHSKRGKDKTNNYNFKIITKVKINLYVFLKKWKSICVDPAFRLMLFPLDGELDFYLKI